MTSLRRPLGRGRIANLDRDIRDRWALEEPKPVVFLMGLHRSGTTVLYQYLSRVLPMAPLTMQHVVFYPRLVYDQLQDGGRADRESLVDYFETHQMSRRGLDDLSLTPDTVEEYGWILKREAGSFRLSAKTVPTFRDLTRKLTYLRPDASALLLKNPWDTSHAPEIAGIFPGARFIFLCRDPIEILNSELRNAMSMTSRGHPLVGLLTRGMPGVRAALGLVRLGRSALGEERARRFLVQWLANDILKNLEGLHSALQDTPSDRVVQVSYHELVDDTPATLGRLSEFLGLPVSEVAASLQARRRVGDLAPIVAEARSELVQRLTNAGLEWTLGA